MERDEYQLRRKLTESVVALREVQRECQRHGFYDWYTAARSCAEEMQFIERKLELERERELARRPPSLPGLDGHV